MITLKKPYYNQNVSAEICIENPEVPMCQKYITEDTGADVITIDEKVKEYLKKNNITTTTAKSDASNDGNFFTILNSYSVSSLHDIQEMLQTWS